MQSVAFYRDQFEEYLSSGMTDRDPKSLYDPMFYILKLGGKRLRPVLTLLSADLFGGDPKEAFRAAMAIEYFHNFSLIHDDIMDAAPLRRGKTTVHKKWDLNTGILSGDAMLIEAYRFLEPYPPKVFKDLTTLFSKTAMEVCEGQQYDIDFETQEEVSVPQYLKMIKFKTAVLVGAAMKMGAITAGASLSDQEKIYSFGLYLGVAFQLQDDYLDVFGDPKVFGKQVGGDIIENKKTYLYLKALEQGDLQQARELKDLFSIQPKKTEKKIKRVIEIYDQSGASKETKEAIAHYTNKAFDCLNTLDISQEKKEVLLTFGRDLMGRKV
ncbi:MAG: polyprenyl synthetase family protein [Muriicola sp.]|nr:polyprenyl synthetase family protein [Muriicola sp.]NNK11184.1 polyprenyl synthetase family protein [Flavobacteriaceae bacterium]